MWAWHSLPVAVSYGYTCHRIFRSFPESGLVVVCSFENYMCAKFKSVGFRNEMGGMGIIWCIVLRGESMKLLAGM